VLDKADYNHGSDYLVCLGDYLDRGPDSYRVVDKIKSLSSSDKVILLKGNHEVMAKEFLDVIQSRDYPIREKDCARRYYFKYGGKETLESYNFDLDKFREDVDWLNELKVTYCSVDYIFAHAGIRPEVPYYCQSEEDMLWIRDEFIYADCDFFKEKRKIIAGHTPFAEVAFLGNRIVLDTGAGKGGKLSLMDLTSGKIYESNLTEN